MNAKITAKTTPKKQAKRSVAKIASKPSIKARNRPVEAPVRDIPAIAFVPTLDIQAQVAVILMWDDKKLSPLAKKLGSALAGLTEHHVQSHGTFKAGSGDILNVTLPKNAPYLRVIVVGLGSAAKADATSFETAGGKLAQALGALGVTSAALINGDDINAEKRDVTGPLLYGLQLAQYSFDHYKTTIKKDAPRLAQVNVITQDAKKQAVDSAHTAALIRSVFLTRDLINEPPNKLYPESFAARIKKTLTPLGVEVQIFDAKTIAKMGMGCLTAVGQASEHPPCLVIMKWKGGASTKKQTKPLAFVGKGITFDSGGLNVKPYEGMLDMKMDMGGAATVTGLMHMLASRKCKVPVVAAVALAENAISDEATRPSDIITSYSGKTVEVLNTDAEGRLVLADALTYIQKTFDPALVVDLATLTGAIMIALGVNHCGAFVNDDKLWSQLEGSSKVSGEKLWRMPLDPSFRKEMDSTFADIKNVGNGRYGGSCTAAAFLGEFIDEGRAWAHLDIAGVAMSKSTPTCPVPFASGFGVKLLNRFVEENFG